MWHLTQRISHLVPGFSTGIFIVMQDKYASSTGCAFIITSGAYDLYSYDTYKKLLDADDRLKEKFKYLVSIQKKSEKKNVKTKTKI
jgi:hypothetical protein